MNTFKGLISLPPETRKDQDRNNFFEVVFKQSRVLELGTTVISSLLVTKKSWWSPTCAVLTSFFNSEIKLEKNTVILRNWSTLLKVMTSVFSSKY